METLIPIAAIALAAPFLLLRRRTPGCSRCK
jgi:hypothetical protein